MFAQRIVGWHAATTKHTDLVLTRHNGTAPAPVWSDNRERHRLSRTGNRLLNAAIHRIAIAQARYLSDAQSLLRRRRTSGHP